jgi:hypothetical protein
VGHHKKGHLGFGYSKIQKGAYSLEISFHFLEMKHLVHLNHQLYYSDNTKSHLQKYFGDTKKI